LLKRATEGVGLASLRWDAGPTPKNFPSNFPIPETRSPFLDNHSTTVKRLGDSARRNFNNRSKRGQQHQSHPPPRARYRCTSADNSFPCVWARVSSAEKEFVSFVSTSK